MSEVDVAPVPVMPVPVPTAPSPLPAPPLNTDSEAVVSPTGTPIIPPAAVPYIAGVVGIAGVVHEAVPNPTVQLVTAIILAVGAVLGIASPGWRKQA